MTVNSEIYSGLRIGHSSNTEIKPPSMWCSHNFAGVEAADVNFSVGMSFGYGAYDDPGFGVQKLNIKRIKFSGTDIALWRIKRLIRVIRAADKTVQKMSSSYRREWEHAVCALDDYKGTLNVGWKSPIHRLIFEGAVIGAWEEEAECLHQHYLTPECRAPDAPVVELSYGNYRRVVEA